MYAICNIAFGKIAQVEMEKERERVDTQMSVALLFLLSL